MTMDLVSMRTGQHADPALTSEATLCGNLKRKFGERSAHQFTIAKAIALSVL